MKFSETYVSFVLLGLIVVGAISFVVQLQTDNEVAPITNDSEFGSLIGKIQVNLTNNLESSQDTTNASQEAFQSEVPEPSFGSLIVFAIVGVVTTFTGILTGLYAVLIVIPSQILQIPPILMSAIATLLGTLFVLMAWRVYRAGE
jgi:hypothetical protein